MVEDSRRLDVAADPAQPSADSTHFTPRNPQYRERVAQSFYDQRIMRMFGAELGEIGPGTMEVRLPFREELTQQHGRLHGGIIGVLLDNACSGAAFTLFPAGTAILCAEYKVNFLAAAKGDELIARARVVKPGRTLTVALGEAYVRNGHDDPKLVAVSQSTLMCVATDGSVPEG